MAIIRSRAQPSELGDAELIQRSRSGDRAAFAELWRRHSRAGVTVARSYTSTFDPEDLVAESYAKIFQAIQSGGGPTGAFRPYLFTTIRNTAASWGRAKRETAIDDVDQIEDPRFSDESTLAALDRSLTATAFRSLPTRWQEALWYSEVESMTPQEIAPLLGMKANGVAALTYRAREGLRQAWIQAHLSSLPADSECRWSIDHLGAYARDGLSKRDTARVDHHLSGCAKCTIVAAEAKEVGSRLTLVLLPLAAGLAGATGYAAWLQSGSHAAAYALGAGGVVMPAAAFGGSAVVGAGAGGSGAVGGAGAGGAAGGAGTGGAGGVAGTATAGATAGASAAGASGVVIGSIVTGVLVAAGVTAAIALGPTLFGGSPPKANEAAAPPASTTEPLPSSTAPTSTPAPTPAPTTAPAPTPPAAPPVASSTVGAAPAVAPAAPPAAPSAPSITDATLTGGTLALSGTGGAGNTVVVTAQQIGGGGGGTARAAVVPAALEVARTTVGNSGAWSISADLSSQLPSGTYTFSVVQIGPSGTSTPATTPALTLNVVVVPAAPVITSPDASAPVHDRAHLVVAGTGETGADVAVTWTHANGESTTLHTTVENGTWNISFADASLRNGRYTISVTQTNDAGTSPAATRTVTVAIPPAAPTDLAVDTGGGLYYPIVSGMGIPGATIVVADDGGDSSAPITVDQDGTWITPQLDWAATSVTAKQIVDGVSSVSSDSQPVTLSEPVLSIDKLGDQPIDQGFLVNVTGHANAPFTLFADGQPWLKNLRLDSKGAYYSGPYTWIGRTSDDNLGVRYEDGDRYGPTTSIPFQVNGYPQTRSLNSSGTPMKQDVAPVDQ